MVLVTFAIAVKCLQPVSVEILGMRLVNAAPILAKALGVEAVRINPILANDVVIIRCKDVAPETLEAKIAKTLNATWETEGNVLRLTQSPAQQAQERRIDDEEMHRPLTELVARDRKKVAEMPVFDAKLSLNLQKQIESLAKSKASDDENAWLISGKIDRQGPNQRLLARFGGRVTADMIGRLTLESPRAVYCTNPTPTQYAFPFPVEDLIRSLVAEQSTWLNAAGPDKVSRSGKTGADDGDEEIGSFGDLNDSRSIYKLEDFATVTMVLDLNGTIDIRAYDKNGNSTFDAHHSSVDDEMLELMANELKDNSPPVRPTPVELKGEPKTYHDFIFPTRRRQTPPTTPPDANLMAKIRQPEVYDPLSFSAPLVALEGISQPNVVAVLTDSFAAMTTGGVFDALSQPGREAIKEADSEWLTFRFKNPINIRRHRIDRSLLGNIIRFAPNPARELSLDEESSLAAAISPEDLRTSLMSRYLTAFQARLAKSGDIDGLRIYGMLSQEQRRLCAKEGVPIRSLPSNLQTHLTKLLFFGDRSEIANVEHPDSLPEAEQRRLTDLEILFEVGIYQDPTFAMPKGLLGSYLLRTTETRGNLLSVPRLGQTGASGGLNNRTEAGPRMMGSVLFAASKLELTASSAGSPRFDTKHIRIRVQHQMTIHLMIDPTVSYDWNLTYRTDEDPTVYSLESLPEAFRKEIQEGYKEAEEAFKANTASFPAVPGRSVDLNPPPP